MNKHPTKVQIFHKIFYTFVDLRNGESYAS